MFPTTTQDRRRSWNSLSTTENWRPRSASAGVIEISPFSRNLSGHRTPATPCFVSPRMAFSTQFNYDSPIQVLTSSSPCIFQPMSVRRLKKRCSLSRLPHRCKILLIVLCLSFAGSLYFFRSLKEGNETPVPCTGENCDLAVPDHPSLQRFLGTIDQQQPHHSLTQDLDNPNVDLPNAPSLNNDFQYYETTGHQPYSVDGTPNTAEQVYMNNANSLNKPGRVSGVYIESNRPEDANSLNKPGRVSGVYIESNRPEDALNSTTHLGQGALLYHPPNGLEVQSITKFEDLPLAQQDPDGVMHERERRDSTSDNQLVQETKTFQTYPGQEEGQFAEPQNGRREETVTVNYPKEKAEALIYSQSRPENAPNAIPENPQGEHLYFYAQNGNQMGNPISGPPRRFDDSHNFHNQNEKPGQEGRQPQLSEREIEARMTRHYIPKENTGEVFQHSMERAYQERPMQTDHRSGEMQYMRNEHFMYDEPPMDRFPPGVNPRRYRHEF